MIKYLSVVLICGMGIVLGSLVITSFLIAHRVDVRTYGNLFMPLKDLEGKFIASDKENMSGITFTLRNPGLQDKNDYSVLIKSNDGETLYEYKFSGYNVEYPSDLPIRFDPPLVSNSNLYYIEIYSHSSEGLLEVAVDEEIDMVMTTYYSAESQLKSLFQQFTNFFQRLTGDRLFLAGWISLNILIISTIIWQENKKAH